MLEQLHEKYPMYQVTQAATFNREQYLDFFDRGEVLQSIYVDGKHSQLESLRLSAEKLDPELALW